MAGNRSENLIRMFENDDSDIDIGFIEELGLDLNDLPDMDLDSFDLSLLDSGSNATSSPAVSSIDLGELLRNNQEFTTEMLSPFLESLSSSSPAEVEKPDLIAQAKSAANICEEDMIEGSGSCSVDNFNEERVNVAKIISIEDVDVKIKTQKRKASEMRNLIVPKKKKTVGVNAKDVWCVESGGAGYTMTVKGVRFELPCWWSNFSSKRKRLLEGRIRREISYHGIEGAFYVGERYCRIKDGKLEPILANEKVTLGGRNIVLDCPIIRRNGREYSLPVHYNGYPLNIIEELTDAIVKNERRHKFITRKWGRVFRLLGQKVFEGY